jgi:tetratricopeptide (TPR) repeat protein
MRIAEQLDDKSLRIEGHVRLGTLLFNLGDLTTAEGELERASTLSAELGSLRDQARASFLLALVKHYQGELEESQKIGLQAADWLERTGDTFFQLQNLRTLALHALARPDFPLAEQRLRDAIPLSLEVGGALVVDLYRLLVDALIGQDRIADARELAHYALANVPEGDAYSKAAAFLIEARLLSAENRLSAAREYFAAALQLLEEQRLPLDLAEARLAYGRALRQLGDGDGARMELGSAREESARMGARGLVEEVDRELSALSEGAGTTGPLASA